VDIVADDALDVAGTLADGAIAVLHAAAASRPMASESLDTAEWVMGTVV
jgi:hypothetical protein